MDFIRKQPFHYSVVISLIGVVFLAATALYLSGNFQSITTNILKPKASMAVPKITQSITEPFKTDSINTDRWQVGKSDGVTVVQTAANNLRIDVPAGAANGRARQGFVTYKQQLKAKGDFRLVAVVFRPIVTGEGNGVAGMRFASTGDVNDEGASMRWIVNGTSSKAVFTVTAADGTVLISKSADLIGNIAVFRLIRVNKAYRGAFSVGSDTSGDTAATVLGEIENQSLGKDGYLSLFGSNGGANKMFPKVIARFDTAWIGWEGAPAPASTRNAFSDNFANGAVAAKWISGTPTTGVSVVETPADNLNINIVPGSNKGVARTGRLVRRDPVVPNNKDFQMNVNVFKPRVTGNGTGIAGIAFVSNTNADDEDARVQWVVSGSTSRVVFVVRAPDGTMLERTAVNVTAPKLVLSLRRTGTKYQAWYRAGDSDSDYIQIGQEMDGSLGGDGKLRLFAGNTGIGKLFPQVIARFDSVSGWVEK